MAKRMCLIGLHQASSLAGILLLILSTAFFSEAVQAQEASADSQMRMVRPTDPEYKALQTLIRKYSCLSRFWIDRGLMINRALVDHLVLSNYEFASILFICGEYFDQMVGAYPGSISEEDASLLQRLQWAYVDKVSAIWKGHRNLEERTGRSGQRYDEKRFCIFDLLQDVCVTQLPPPEFQRLKLQRIQLPEELFTYHVQSSQSTLVPMLEQGAKR